MRALVRVVPIAVFATGCIGPLRKTHPDLPQLMEAYRTENVAVRAREDSLARARYGRVEVAGASPALTLSVDVRDASVAAVLRRALEAAPQGFVYEGGAPSGMVTARFEQQPLVAGLNILLEPHDFTAVLRDGLVVVRPAAPTAAAAQAGPTMGGPQSQAMGEPQGRALPTVQSEVPVEHLDAKAAGALVDGFLRGGQLRALFDAARSRVLLWGSEADVNQAIAIIRRADQPTQHVFLEALVVEFDVETMRQLGVSFSGGQTGNFSQILFTPGNLTGATLQLLREYGHSNPKAFVAAIQAVSGTDKARVVARPYISARSGEPATVNIGRTRYYITQTFQAGQLTAGSTSVETGVQLRITPTALPGNRVRVDMHVEESQFIPTTDNAAAETDKNVAETSMQVPSGQTIIIGGLALDRQSHDNTGIPILRDIPFLKLFGSQESMTGKNQEVVIFITPHIWDPSMDPPLVVPGAFGARGDDRPIRP
ncbi:MAG: putative ral secretion pathway protein [Gemmatimonadetes bacterium]|nr:putative ral secretion pathway protein [Gemmatimonadota bacterium]